MSNCHNPLNLQNIFSFKMFLLFRFFRELEGSWWFHYDNNHIGKSNENEAEWNNVFKNTVFFFWSFAEILNNCWKQQLKKQRSSSPTRDNILFLIGELMSTTKCFSVHTHKKSFFCVRKRVGWTVFPKWMTSTTIQSVH